MRFWKCESKTEIQQNIGNIATSCHFKFDICKKIIYKLDTGLFMIILCDKLKNAVKYNFSHIINMSIGNTEYTEIYNLIPIKWMRISGWIMFWNWFTGLFELFLYFA